MTFPTLPDWSRISTVCLDMDGTVLDLRFDNHFWLEEVPRRYAARHGLEPDAALDRLRPRLDAVRGTLEWYCVDYWSAELELDVTALKHELRDRIRYLPGAIDFLTRVRALGKQLLLTTNAHPRTLAVKDEQVGLGRHFDALVSSHDYGVPKESNEFWPRFTRDREIDPATTLFVDDSPPVLDAAKLAGVASIYQILRPDSTLPARAPHGQLAGIRGLSDLFAAVPRE